MAYIYDMAATWAAAGTTFTAIKMNVTDTASAAGSLLMDLQVGGASRVSAQKDGQLNAVFFNATGGIYVDSSNGFRSDNSGVQVGSNKFFAFRSGVNTGGVDLALFRDAANTLAQRNGVNAQTLRVYNTFTDASNYERGKVEWAAGEFRIGMERAGTGSNRGIRVQGPLYINLEVAGVDRIGVGTTVISANLPIEFTEQTAPAAPSANRVRIYAEDNGAGKTRLMALFATGAAVQIAIEP